MPLVPAKCPQCGGDVEVDDRKDAAICTFCNTAFIIEKAINNYNNYYNKNITITGGEVHIHNDSSNVDSKKIFALLDRRASTFFNETKDDELLKKLYDRYYESNFDNININEMQVIDAINSIKRSIENDSEDEVDTLQYCLEEAKLILSNLLEIKNADTKLYERLYSDFKTTINDYLSDIMGVSFTGGSLMVKMLYADLFAKFYGEYISSVYTTTNNMDLSFSYYFDNYEYAEVDDDGDYSWPNNSGFLEEDDDYDDYCECLDEYIMRDPFDDVDERYLSFTKTIYDVVVKNLSRELDRHCEYMERHFSLIKYSDTYGKKEAYRYLFTFMWVNYRDFVDEGSADYYFGLKSFYIFTKNKFIKKVLDEDFKVSLFGNVSLRRKDSVDVTEMVNKSMEMQGL